jgi:hypothetical protein
MASYPLLNVQNGLKWDISANNVDLVGLNGNGTSGQYLKSNGTTVAPSWATLPVIPATLDLSAVLLAGNSASTDIIITNGVQTSTLGVSSLVIVDTTGPSAFPTGTYGTSSLSIVETFGAQTHTANVTFEKIELKLDNSSLGNHKNIIIDNANGANGTITFDNTINSVQCLNLITNTDLQLDIVADFVLNGSAITSSSQNGSSGTYLRIKLNSVYYKLDLLVD